MTWRSTSTRPYEKEHVSDDEEAFYKVGWCNLIPVLKAPSFSA
jgi:hypothetical protein